MPENIAYRGQKFTISYAVRHDGSMPAAEFLAAQEVRWQLRIFHLFRILGEFGVIRNDEQFKRFKDPFYEFKAFQIRMPCYFREGRSVVVTHGFLKKRNGAAPKQEAERAESIKTEYEQRISPALGKKERR